jgi:hypothetical protein
MQLPSNIDELFTQTFEGYRAVRLHSALDALMVEDALTQQRRSYTTQINRSKKHGREFIILLLDASGTPDGT